MQGRALIADFSEGPPIRSKYWETWYQFGELEGWHDPGDIQVVGDFMGLGHDQVLFINQTILSEEEQRIIDLTNEKRQQVGGCPPVQFDLRLMNVAQAHSEDLARNHPRLYKRDYPDPQYKGHYGSDGSLPPERILRAMSDYQNWKCAENVAKNDSAQHAFDGWFNETPPDDGHHRHILDCDYSYIGVGIARAPDGTIYYTQDFWNPNTP